MATTKNPTYGCPFCPKTVQGPPNSPKLGARNFYTHVETSHPKDFEAFKKNPIENYIVDEPEDAEEPVQQTEQQTKQTVQQQPTFEPLIKAPPQVKVHTSPPQEPTDAGIVIPFQDKPAPQQWLESFLKTQVGIKDKFIFFQKQKVKLTGELPDPRDLEKDLKLMESGLKNEREAYYVKIYYKAALEEYMRVTDIDRDYGMDQDYGRRGIRMEREEELGRGIPIRRTYRADRDRDEYGSRPPSYRGQPPPSYIEEELQRLRDKDARRDEEDRRRRDQENVDLKAKIDALTTQLQTGGGGGGGGNLRLETKIEQLESESRHRQEQYDLLKEQTMNQRLSGLEAMIRTGVPSTEDLKTFMTNYIEQYRNQLMVEKNLEDLVDKKIQAHSGPTQAAVEMEKARNDLALGIKKIDADQARTTQWGDTIQKAAGALGDGIGRAMGGGGQPPQQQQQQAPQQQQPCPHCKTPLILPANAHYGVCPQCQGKIEVDENGALQKYIEPQEPQQQPPQQPQTPPGGIP